MASAGHRAIVVTSSASIRSTNVRSIYSNAKERRWPHQCSKREQGLGRAELDFAGKAAKELAGMGFRQWTGFANCGIPSQIPKREAPSLLLTRWRPAAGPRGLRRAFSASHPCPEVLGPRASLDLNRTDAFALCRSAARAVARTRQPGPASLDVPRDADFSSVSSSCRRGGNPNRSLRYDRPGSVADDRAGWPHPPVDGRSENARRTRGASEQSWLVSSPEFRDLERTTSVGCRLRYSSLDHLHDHRLTPAHTSYDGCVRLPLGAKMEIGRAIPRRLPTARSSSTFRSDALSRDV